MIGRSYLVLAALCSLVVFATSASAECAWVLWQQASGSGSWSLDTGMQIAFQTRVDCEQQLKARLAFIAELNKRISGPTPFLSCLPDTVDPRGPKGAK